MKKVIFLIATTIILTANDQMQFKIDPNMAMFQKEASRIWREYTGKTKKEEIEIKLTLSKEQAKIDIIKAEIQKLFLKYIEQGIFEEDKEIKINLVKIKE